MVKEDDKIYEEHVIDLNFELTERRKIRDFLIQTFLKEDGGYWKEGKKHVTKYRYFVETIKDGRRVFLQRPAHLNKGFDFQVYVERFQGDKDKKPSHKDIVNDLKIKKAESLDKFQKLLVKIEKVWSCNEINNIISEIDFEFTSGYSIELILKVLKWLFIEQDVTYWNYDGREMLFRGIKEI